jgi:CheY-like chemotaxis protein
MVEKKHQFQQVLIIDDDFSSLYLARMVLEEMHIAQNIIYLQSAGEGLRLLRQTCFGEQATGVCPDLILLDINMPQMDGFDFLQYLVALGQQSLISRVVVALSSSNTAKDRQRMESYGVWHYMEKPITEEKILELVK